MTPLPDTELAAGWEVARAAMAGVLADAAAWERAAARHWLGGEGVEPYTPERMAVLQAAFAMVLQQMNAAVIARLAARPGRHDPNMHPAWRDVLQGMSRDSDPLVRAGLEVLELASAAALLTLRREFGDDRGRGFDMAGIRELRNWLKAARVQAARREACVKGQRVRDALAAAGVSRAAAYRVPRRR